MEKVRYMISDAANMVALEQHVLRYWEDELQLNIPRNEMGHRYYTEENIKEFLRIKELKEKGYQLKAIRMYLKKERERASREQEKERQFLTMTNSRELGLHSDDDDTLVYQPEQTHQVKMEQFQALMTDIVRIALENNNEALSNEVGDRILKEMNYLMQENQQIEEDRYKKLDAAIRGKRKLPKEKQVRFAPQDKEAKHTFFKKKKEYL